MVVAALFSHPVCGAPALSAWVSKGFQALADDEPRRALECFQKAREEMPSAAEVDCYVGLGHFKNAQYEQAIEFFDRAARRDASIVDSAFLFYRASAHRALGLRGLEIEAWNALVEWDPDSSFAEAARRAADEAVRRDPSSAESLLGAGLKAQYTWPNAAAAYFREALGEAGGEWAGEIAVHLICALNRAGRCEEALAMEAPVLEDGGLREIWVLQRALALAGLSRWEEAAAELESAAEDAGPQAEYLRALCRVHLGGEGEATAVARNLEGLLEKEMTDTLTRLAQQHSLAGAAPVR